MQLLVSDYLSSVTLEDVVKGQKAPSIDPKYADPNAFAAYAMPACAHRVDTDADAE